MRLPIVVQRAARRPWLWGAVLVAIVSGAAVTLVGLLADSEFWYVAVPTYLTGVGTLAAAIAAVGIAVYSSRADERRRTADAELESLREARKNITLCGSDAGRFGGVVVRNYSTEPITMLSAESVNQERVEEFSEPLWRWEFGNGVGAVYAPVLTTGEEFCVGGFWWQPLDDDPASLPRQGTARRPPNYLTSALVATVAWRDCRGQRWRRRGANDPTRVTA